MNKDIIKSSEMLQNQAKIKDLLSTLKEKNIVLKSAKTTLQNTKNEIDQAQRYVGTKVFHKMEEVDNRRLEVIELAKQFSQSNNISAGDKEQFQLMVEDLSNQEGGFGDGFAAYKQTKAQQADFDFEENHRATMNDIFQRFQIKPAEEEQNDINKIFIKLSQKLDADLTKNEAEQSHVIMEKLKGAYQNNDIQTLLEIEQNYISETQTPTADTLQKEINRLNRDLNLINHQIDRTSSETQTLRDSEIGQMTDSLNQEEKDAEGFSVMERDLEAMMIQMNTLKEGLVDSIKRDEVSPILMEMNQPNIDEALAQMGMPMDMFDDNTKGKMQEMMLKMQKGELNPQEMLNDLLGGGGGMDMFGGLFGNEEAEEEEEDVFENAKFPLSSSVKIIGDYKNPHLERLNMNGWVGRIVDAYSEDEIVYEVELDSISMKKLPDSIIAVLVEEGQDFQNYHVKESDLEKAEERDLSQQTFALYRQLFHQHNWSYLPSADAQRMKKILLQEPEVTDIQNWTNYFQNNLSFPFETQFQEETSNEELIVTVTGIAGTHEDHGIIMTLEGNNRYPSYPLSEMEVIDENSKNYSIVEDYLEWADQSL